MAVDENLNLVLEDELADPPVCRIVEAARYVYEQNKRGTKKNQQSPEVKDLRVRLHIAENDYAIKLKAARRMLDKGSSVRFAVQLRVKRGAHPPPADDSWRVLCDRLIQDLSACSVVASPPVKGANSARFMLAPNST
ncbi:hypothetical protein H632_c892p1 [Helicosporidium sp. ATCC 50920]|nr:hypothetical protein H632_c892p1 [Helicosporidium sp. ATCC 50920]|eukprot:KDD75067.1 hypothetical protein H632_c892p1 [Helicosporidium sp. ATCC 50920]